MNETSTTVCRGFAVNRRNYGHWDVYIEGSRAFCIRGGPGNYLIRDERIDEARPFPRENLKGLKTVQAAMGWITENLMFELIIAEGQTPHVIEAWNI